MIDVLLRNFLYTIIIQVLVTVRKSFNGYCIVSEVIDCWEGGHMINILIADDEKEIIKLLCLYLENEDTNIYEAYDGEMAWMMLQNYCIDLALVDIMMPKMSGYELIKKVSVKINIPIMVISAKGELSDRILGLDLGADDYITKPFEPLEVAAKVKARLRRMHADIKTKQNDSYTIRDLTLNVNECTIEKNGTIITLTKVEFLIMQLFISHPGRVYTKEQIYNAAWGEAYAVDDNTIRVAISKLRDKIGTDYIRTIRGLGYRLEKE